MVLILNGRQSADLATKCSLKSRNGLCTSLPDPGAALSAAPTEDQLAAIFVVDFFL
jgi:hypothetical protein